MKVVIYLNDGKTETHHVGNYWVTDGVLKLSINYNYVHYPLCSIKKYVVVD